jgi:hypothetical protein
MAASDIDLLPRGEVTVVVQVVSLIGGAGQWMVHGQEQAVADGQCARPRSESRKATPPVDGFPASLPENR